MVECEPILEYVVACFFGGECEKCEIFVKFRLGEAHEFVLFPVVVALPGNGFKNVECMLISKCFSLEV